jgi:hypothetical protein
MIMQERKLAKYITRPAKERFRQALIAEWESREDEELKRITDMSLEMLSRWYGEKLWAEGYKKELEELRFTVRTFDYGSQIGVAAYAEVEKSETVRQFCYQFVKLAEEVLRDYETVKNELDAIKSSWYYKLFNLFKRDEL